ncbi:MAG: DUF1906 domain-containing protein [Roseiflexaceae bacterium]
MIIIVLLFGSAAIPAYAVAPGGSNVVLGDDAMDKLCASTVSTMATWWSYSPYWGTVAYIGGANRSCANVNLTADWVSRVHDQGWDFMPTWAGPQAPCGQYGSVKISTDLPTARTQGTNDATSAFNTAVNYGFTKGTIIYFDIEAYDTSNSGCHAAVDAFLDAWVAKMRSLGNRVGIYGSSCGSDATSWARLAHVPDDVWLGAWISPIPNTSSTMNIPCVDNGLWIYQQRIHQYTGNSTETYGGVQLIIHRNCPEGHVAGTHAWNDGNPNNCSI